MILTSIHWNIIFFRIKEIFFLGSLFLLIIIGAGCSSQHEENEKFPNIIFILADDLGYAELGCYGNTFNETPNLDMLASKGVQFTNAYAAAPVCSPYRASLMTGQYPARLGIVDYLRPNDTNHLDTAYVTMAEMFKKRNYTTGIIGKWHLTGYKNHGAVEYGPDLHGFDEVILSENRGIASGTYFHPYHFNKEIEKQLPDSVEYLVDRLNHEAVNFIDRNQDKPFFLFLSHYAVHTLLHGKPKQLEHFINKEGAGKGDPHKKNPENDPYKKWPAHFMSKPNNPHLAAQLFSIDEGLGMIQEKLETLGITEHTIIIFTSDNGGETRVTVNGELREGKSTLYEGGVREPLIAYYPEKWATNVAVEEQVVNYDFYPTFAQLLDIPLPQGQIIDGVSFLNVLEQPGEKLQERPLYWHYPLEKPHFLGGNSSGSIRLGDWKLVEYFDTGKQELYNLASDISEKNNLAESNPDVVKSLQQQLSQWRKEVNAKIPEGQSAR